MIEIGAAFSTAIELMLHLDHDLGEIVLLSLTISLVGTAAAALCGLPLGAAAALYRFPGRGAVLVMLNAMMGLPPVVVGLVIYLLVSRAGPLGSFGLLFTPTAMVVAQAVLVLPIVTALTQQIVADLAEEYDRQLRSLGTSRHRAMLTLLWDGRYQLFTVVLAGFGRAAAEVGAVIIVGGNINHYTRVMTTTIALETSKGDIPLALALSMILITLSLGVNVVALGVRGAARRYYG
jgi:tungstate transport system permease protein